MSDVALNKVLIRKLGKEDGEKRELMVNSIDKPREINDKINPQL